MAYNMLYETYVGADDYSLSLQHHGIKGQKWGVRRFQNPDGSYTDAGRKRRGLTGEPRERRGLSDKQKTMLKRGAAVAASAATAYALYRIASRPSVMAKKIDSIKSMSDDELLGRLGRLEKEKKIFDIERELSGYADSSTKKILKAAGKGAVTTMASAGALYGSKQALKYMANASGHDGDRLLRDMFPKKK